MPGRFNTDPYVSINPSRFPLLPTERRYYSAICQIGNHDEWKKLVPLPLFCMCYLPVFYLYGLFEFISLLLLSFCISYPILGTKQLDMKNLTIHLSH
jgi:hypothetical protein